MQDVSLVSMRPLVMLLDGGPATFLAQNKSTGFVITTNVSWYKSKSLARCVVLHVNETTWQGFLVWSAKQFWLKYRWSDHLLIIYTSRYTPQYPPYPLLRRVLWL